MATMNIGSNGRGKRTKYIYSNGSVYVGELKDNKPNGHGIMTYSDGKKKMGIWEHGYFVGTVGK